MLYLFGGVVLISLFSSLDQMPSVQSLFCPLHAVLLIKGCHPLHFVRKNTQNSFGQNMDAMTFLFVETQAFQVKHMDAFFGNRVDRVDEKPQMLKRCDIKGSPRNYLFHRTFTFYFSHDIFVLILFGSAMIYGKEISASGRQILATVSDLHITTTIAENSIRVPDNLQGNAKRLSEEVKV